MVATVLRLRYRILGNTLSRSAWQLVGFVFGMLAALWMLGLAVSGLVALGIGGDLGVIRSVAVVAGSALILGWLVGPVVASGVDQSVDARHFAHLPVTTRQVMLALTGTGLTGVAGIATSVATLATVALWWRWPFAAIAAVVCVPIAVVTAVLASRLVAAGSGGGRRGNEIIGTVVLIALMLTGPILAGVSALLGSVRDLAGLFAHISAVLAWTPLGAVWAVPGDVAVGAWGTALVRLAIAVATVAVLWWAWGRVLVVRTQAPPRRAVRRGRAGDLGWFGRMPTGPVGATWARSLTAWTRDPRYLRQLIVVPVFPVLFAFVGGIDQGPFLASGVIVGLVVGLAGYTDISYDGTAYTAVLATGIRGRADRWGRMLGAASVVVPLVAVVAVVTALIGGQGPLLAAILGASLGTALVGLGVDAVSSALLVMPVARAGDSPFRSVPGQTFLNGLAAFAVLGVQIVIAAPAIVFAVVAATSGEAVWGAAALATGLVVGLGACVGGAFLGGRILDRTGPDLLARIRTFPTN